MPSNSREKNKKLRVELIGQMVALSTAGFGLVAALAWNNLIQELVNSYVKKWFPSDGKIISLLIYALVVTFLAVIVTYQLTKLKERVED